MNNDQDKNKSTDNNNDYQKIYPHMLPMDTLFIWFIGILNSKAWEYLGLLMNPETKEIKQDLAKAKISIDCIEYLLKQIKDNLDIKDRRQIEDLLANLRMNYVEKINENKKDV